MLDTVNNLILHAQPTTLIIVGGTVFGLLFMVPRVMTKLGVKKIAGIELNSQNEDYTLQYRVNEDVSELDTQLKESLWEYTEDLLMDFAETSPLNCDAAIGHVLGGIFGHIRAHIMMNHLVDKLAVKNEEAFVKKLTRNVRASISDAKRSVYEECPCKHEMEILNIDRYRPVIDQWMSDARIMVSQTCEAKIDVYKNALKGTRSEYWRDVFKSCIEKNEHYIKGLEERRPSRRRDERCED